MREVKVSHPRGSVNWAKTLNLVMLLLLALPLLGTAPAAPAVAPRVQDVLLPLVSQDPGATLPVIVQKAGHGADVEALVRRLGGTVTEDLHIINAFAAQVPASSLAQLGTAPGVRWVSLDGPTHSAGDAVLPVFVTWATVVQGEPAAPGLAGAAAIADSATGPNGTYAVAGRDANIAVGDFVAEETPGYAISKVEVLLRAYTPAPLGAADDPTLVAVVAGLPGKAVVLNHHAFDKCVGAANACTAVLDITKSRAWRWSDFDQSLELRIGQARFDPSDSLYYDAVGLRVTAMPGVDTSVKRAPTSLPHSMIDTGNLRNAFNAAVGATRLWNEAPAYLQGQGQTVAVVDSGIFKTRDLGHRLIGQSNFNRGYHDAADRYGHGTFVAGIIAGDGSGSAGQYVGIAPKTNILNVRVSDDAGGATESDVIRALQWVNDNRARYNIRVANLSLNASVAASYHTSPLDAACEILWFNGVVVVAAAGNNGSNTLYPPANDPFVITVGAIDDLGTASLNDDVVATFSAYGVAEDGTPKPDLVAPGRNVISSLPENNHLNMSRAHAANRVDDDYFRMSGTSVAAPIVSGAVALLLQDEPGLTPDQVKGRLKATAARGDRWPGYDAARAGAGTLDIYAAVHSAPAQNANTGIAVSRLLTTGTSPVNSSVNWNSVNWNSVNWNSVNWNSVNWNSVNWNSDYWGN